MPPKLVEMLRTIRYALSDAAYAIGDFTRPAWRPLAEAWSRLELSTRRRVAVAGSAIAIVLVVTQLIAPALPCSFPGGDTCVSHEAHTDALGLVPSTAVAYVHADVGRSRDQYVKAVAIANRTPLVTQQVASIVLSQFLGPAGQRSDFSNQIRPWLGNEVLIATLSSDDGGGQLQMLQVANQQGAEAYARSIASPNPDKSVYRGVEVSVDARGLSSAIAGGFLLIGREAGVRAAIDVATNAPGAESIADDPVTSKVRDQLPDDSIVDTYVARLGLAGLFGKGAPLAPVAQFIDPATSQGFGAAVVATDGGLELSTASSLDPSAASDPTPAAPAIAPRSGGSAFSTLPPFDPQLASRVQGDAFAYVGIGDPANTLQDLLESAGHQAPGFLGGLSNTLRQLGKSGKVDLAKLVPTLGDEAAFAVIPRVDPSSGISGDNLPGQSDSTETLPPDAGAIPYIELLSDVSDEDGATAALTTLQGAIAEALGTKSSFSSVRLGGVEAQALRISPTAQVAYSVFDSLFVFATDPAGVTSTADLQDDALSATDLYSRATEGLSNGSSLLAFFNLTTLVRFVEASGQGANPAYATFASDLRKLQALAVSVRASDDSLTTTSRLLIGQQDASQLDG